MTEENKEQNITPISAEELAKQEEVQAEEEQEKVEVDATEEEPSKKEETDTASENDSPEKSEEGEKENGKENGEVPPSDEGNEGDGEGSEEVSEDVEGDTEKVEDKPVVEEGKEEPEAVESVEELKAQIEEYKFNEEERAGLQNLAGQIQSAQAELDDFDAKVDMALRDALVDNKIDLDKSLDELAKENPAAHKIAISFIQQANQVKEQHAAEVIQKVRDVQNTLIFKRAEREFAKYNLTAEEAEVAADTFIKIMHEVGINDLNEDLKTKVSLSVGQSRINKVAEAPKAEEVVEEAPVEAAEDTSKIEEVVKNKPTEEKEAIKEEKKEEKPAEEPEKKVVVDLDEYMADPTTSAAGAKKSDYTDTSILSELAKLRGKEQQAFYVEHATEINKAMAEVRKNMGIGR